VAVLEELVAPPRGSGDPTSPTHPLARKRKNQREDQGGRRLDDDDHRGWLRALGKGVPGRRPRSEGVLTSDSSPSTVLIGVVKRRLFGVPE
jgi:hypothetical protein